MTKIIKVNDNISDAKREQRRTERRNLSDLAIFKAKKGLSSKAMILAVMDAILAIA